MGYIISNSILPVFISSEKLRMVIAGMNTTNNLGTRKKKESKDA
ncbi:hypothetical protein JBKA6_1438 [Ichthyobacterium seriolicida]|uniref:Uncharacterized protein n=1 Tax=Ichthyobacterium seriolicida TaxID=242600 RepID=A0A1J1EBY4_9FLAO|nr:hypothetical protein JBKA6_1438 [Ichthyobacterium seriolicida]